MARNRHHSAPTHSLDDDKSLDETAYLLRSPANAKRLLAAVDGLQAGKGKQRKLIAQLRCRD
jgi:antitoxin YefM